MKLYNIIIWLYWYNYKICIFDLGRMNIVGFVKVFLFIKMMCLVFLLIDK